MPRNFGNNEIKIVLRNTIFTRYTISKKKYLIWFFSRHSRTREDSSAMYVLSDAPLNPVMPLAKNCKQTANKQL